VQTKNPATGPRALHTGRPSHWGQLLAAQAKSRSSATGGGLLESRSLPALQALGRVVGSLCVLSLRRGTEEEAIEGTLVASWVSQAGFSPPAISLSVGRDQPLAELLQVGDDFAINVLPAGREGRLLKLLGRPLPPAPSRLAALDLQAGPAGQPLLSEHLSWLEARVTQRVACGDHWLVVAEVLAGRVLDADGTTAVPQRRSGASH